MRTRSIVPLAAVAVLAVTATTTGVATPVAAHRSRLAPTAVTWVSGGDSYSSGEGVSGNVGACAQSNVAYGPKAANALATQQSWKFASNVFTACTGHLVEDEFNTRPDAGPKASLWQWGLDQNSPDRVDVISMSFGGNDIGFADVIADCLNVIPDAWSDLLNPPTAVIKSITGCDTSEADIRERIDALIAPTAPESSCRGGRVKSRRVGDVNYLCSLLIDDQGTPTDYGDDERGSIADFYAKIVNEHLTDHGALYIVNYPRIFAPAKEWPTWSPIMCAGVTRGDADRLGRLLDHLNIVIESSVKAANRKLGAEKVFIVDRGSEFRNGSHELCGKGVDWLNGISAFRGTGALRHQTSFHPNAAGHQSTAAQLVKKVTATSPLVTAAAGAAPSANGDITTTAAGPVRSVYTNPAYFADVSVASFTDHHTVIVNVDANGPSDLRRAETSCLRNGNGSIAVPVATALTVDTPGRFAGTLEIPILQPGTWSFNYSCQRDYTSAPLVTATTSGIWTSIFSAAYYATVFGFSRAADGTITVRFASHSASAADLRDPVTSCFLGPDGSIVATSAVYQLEVPGRFYAGTLAFPQVPGEALEFQYSCQGDYTTVGLSGAASMTSTGTPSGNASGSAGWPTRDNEGPPVYFTWLGASLLFPSWTSCSVDYCLAGTDTSVLVTSLKPLNDLGEIPLSTTDPLAALVALGVPEASAAAALVVG